MRKLSSPLHSGAQNGPPQPLAPSRLIRRGTIVGERPKLPVVGMNALVILAEGLGSGMLGAYGSATCITPAIDRLAARSLVLDRCSLDSLDFGSQLRSLWTATHAAAAQPSAVWSMWRALAEHGIPAKLITDSPDAARCAQELGCEEIMLVDPPHATEPAGDAEQCAMMQVFATALDELSRPETQGLVWVHARALQLPWDAPLDLRRSFIDPEDPEPPLDVQLPAFRVDKQTDPDLVIGWGQVAAAQVAVLDQAMEALDAALDQRSDAERWARMITSLGGYPLGEHGQVGQLQPAATSEAVLVPAIFCPPAAPPVGSRRGELCQLPDLVPTLLETLAAPTPLLDAERLWGRSMWSQEPTPPSLYWPREHALAWLVSPSVRSVRTAAWALIVEPSSAEEEPRRRLYAKPDDRWEANDVASRMPAVVAQLEALLEQLPHSMRRADLPVLDLELIDSLR
jgi:hypothetical protein